MFPGFPFHSHHMLHPYHPISPDVPSDFRAFYPYTPNEVKHRKRTTSAQLRTLESVFKRDTKPNAALRNQLAEQLKMTPRGVQVSYTLSYPLDTLTGAHRALAGLVPKSVRIYSEGVPYTKFDPRVSSI